MESNYRNQFQNVFAITEERAEQITNLPFSTEDLKDWRLRAVILSLGDKKALIQSQEARINPLQNRFDYYNSGEQSNKHLKMVNKKSNPERSVAFLRIVN